MVLNYGKVMAPQQALLWYKILILDHYHLTLTGLLCTTGIYILQQMMVLVVLNYGKQMELP